jgi:multimeric flavodoxin WrbA
MKVVAFNGSARRDGNTALMVRRVFRQLHEEDIETELVQLAGERIRGCVACRGCWENKDGHCTQTGDIVNGCIDKMYKADGIILASPVYFSNLTPELKALIDRSGYVARANGSMFRRKAGAAVVAARRAGFLHTFDTLNHFFLVNEMIVPGSSYWNMGVGLKPGDVEGDEEGMNTMEDLGRNMAWLLKRTAD